MTVLRRALLAVSGLAIGGAVAGAATYLGLVSGAAPLDLGIGRRTRPLGPLRIQIAAPPETVFDAIAAPYGERVTRALRDKVRVLDRGTDMVLAAHYTPIRGRLRATTVETVRFDRPERVDFRLVRGPVPHVQETSNWIPSPAAQPSPTPGNSAPTCGVSGSAGEMSSRPAGKPPSTPPSTPSRPMPNAATTDKPAV